MEKSFLTWTAAALGTAILLTACNTNTGTTAPGSKVKLDPSKPVSLTVWHYYNGAQQAAFDQLVSEFNATEGKDKGIYVEGYTQGSVSDLEKAVSDAVSGAVTFRFSSLCRIFSLPTQILPMQYRKRINWRICLLILQRKSCLNMWTLT